jgi:hypothetical protein
MRQAAVSTLYALLNEITRYSDKDASDQPSTILSSNSILGAPAAELLDESQKQQVCVNALSAIVNVAVYLADEAVSNIHLFLLVFAFKWFHLFLDYCSSLFHVIFTSQIVWRIGNCNINKQFSGLGPC